jgi:hypothetical protein
VACAAIRSSGVFVREASERELVVVTSEVDMPREKDESAANEEKCR